MHDFRGAVDHVVWQKKVIAVHELVDHVRQILIAMIDEFDMNNSGYGSVMLWGDEPFPMDVISPAWRGVPYERTLLAATGLRALMRAIGAEAVWPTDEPNLETTTLEPIEARLTQFGTMNLYPYLLHTPGAVAYLHHAATVAHELHPCYAAWQFQHLDLEPVVVDMDVFPRCFAGILKPTVSESQMALVF